MPEGGAVTADKLLAEQLSTALTVGHVEPFFQPIVSLTDGRIVGFEVLARWFDPVRGHISPQQFIPVADRFGLLDRLLDQLMRSAFVAAVEWPHTIFLGFNVSPSQLRDDDLATRVAAAATDSSFPLSRVHIEVTENGFIDDLDQPRRTLERLMNLGCMISMDDFGTGYSSLTWLSTLPFSKLKIDASFVSEMVRHRQSRKIVAAVVGLGHSLGLAVVAEGVETAEQVDALRVMGCNLAQGFLFGRPTPAGAVPAVLAGHPQAMADFTGSVPRLTESLSAWRAQGCAREVAIAFIDPAGTVVASSALFDRALAIPAGQATGRHIGELVGFTPETFAEIRATDLLGQAFSVFEESNGNGDVTPVVIRPVKDSSGELLGYTVEYGDPAPVVAVPRN